MTPVSFPAPPADPSEIGLDHPADGIDLPGMVGQTDPVLDGPTADQPVEQESRTAPVALSDDVVGLARTAAVEESGDSAEVGEYLGATAVITVSGTDIAGSYRKKFTRKGLALDVGPVSLLGGYKLWSARVTAMDGDPPGNDTTVQTATPPGTKCD